MEDLSAEELAIPEIKYECKNILDSLLTFIYIPLYGKPFLNSYKRNAGRW